MKTYTYAAERCPDTGLYVGYVPGSPGAHSQGETPDGLNDDMREVIGTPPEGNEDFWCAATGAVI